MLLVHGYNNDKDEAEKSYRALMENSPDGRESLADQVWWFFWPSYVERLTGMLATMRRRRWFQRARHREQCGVVDADLRLAGAEGPRGRGARWARTVRGLERREGVPTEVVFVAHSLGCRVVLEALRELLDGSSEENERDRVPCVCLMAAAVPTFMIDEGERLERAAALPQASYVLHSRSDAVLQWAFRGGQGAASLLVTLGFTGALEDTERADSEGVYPEAVGRNGRPRSVWLRRADTGLGHSGYWKHRSTAPTVLRAIQRWQHLRVAAERRIRRCDVDAARQSGLARLEAAGDVGGGTLVAAHVRLTRSPYNGGVMYRSATRPAHVPRSLAPACAAAFAALLVALPAAAQWRNLPNTGARRARTASPTCRRPRRAPPSGKPDLTGIYTPIYRYFQNLAADIGLENVPMTSGAQKIHAARATGLLGYEEPDAHCLPQGVPKVNQAPVPFKIVQTDNLVVLVYEAFNLWRQVHLDGREFADDLNPSWMGYLEGPVGGRHARGRDPRPQRQAVARSQRPARRATSSW